MSRDGKDGGLDENDMKKLLKKIDDLQLDGEADEEVSGILAGACEVGEGDKESIKRKRGESNLEGEVEIESEEATRDKKFLKRLDSSKGISPGSIKASKDDGGISR
jgi:hypothetical protein